MTSAPARAELTGRILTVSGYIDPLTVLSVRKQGEALIASAPDDLTVDLSGMGTGHSVVLSLLLCWQRCAARNGHSLRFSGASDQLVALASLSSLDEQLPGFRNETPG